MIQAEKSSQTSEKKIERVRPVIWKLAVVWRLDYILLEAASQKVTIKVRYKMMAQTSEENALISF